MKNRVAAAIENPFNGVIPDFSVFGAEFTELWQKLLGGLWALGLIAAAAFLVLGIVQMAQASASQNPGAHAEGRKKALMAGLALGCLAAVAVITGAILAIFG